MIICCKCSSSNIYTYPADAPEQAICVECCETTEHEDEEVGHEYERLGGDWYCKYCFNPAPEDWLSDYYSDADCGQ